MGCCDCLDFSVSAHGFARGSSSPERLYARGTPGFPGAAEKYHPLPWSSVDYDEDENAYIVNYTKEQLQAAPAASIQELTSGDGRRFREKTYAYYKEPRYWDAAD